MNLWLTAYIALQFIGAGYCVAKHGEPQKPVNAWATIAVTGFVVWLLYMGGAFDQLTIPTERSQS